MTLLVTGGIGSGKSEVCRMLEERGVPVYCCDTRAKELYYEIPSILEEFSARTGVRCFDADGKADLSAVSKVVFRDRGALRLLESLLYPALRDDFMAWKEGKGTVVMESAIALSKEEFRDMYDAVAVVTAPLEVRIRRVMLRDGMGREDVMLRIANQADPELFADIIVHNGGSLEDLSEEVDKLVEFLKTRTYEN